MHFDFAVYLLNEVKTCADYQFNWSINQELIDIKGNLSKKLYKDTISYLMNPNINCWLLLQ